MSASDKKKLRKEQAAAILTKKQQEEQAEAKKLKIYTGVFAGIMALVLVAAIVILGYNIVTNYGLVEKWTTAAVIGDEKLNTVELGYYYTDAVNEYYNGWYEQFSNYTDMYLESVGLNTSLPLNQQQYGDTGMTWADHFVEQAISNAKSDYAFYNAAKKANFVLPAEEQANLDAIIENMESTATIYGFPSANKYLSALYGNGANVKSYKAYLERGIVAEAFKEAHKETFTYQDADIRAFEEGKTENYNHYNYSSAYLSYTDFRTGGTKDANNNTTYTKEEDAAAREAMKTAAEQLANCPTLEDLKSTIETIKVNDTSELVVNDYTNEAHTNINAALSNWLAAAERKEGDIEAIPNEAKITGDDGKETTVINGYYVAYFVSKNDNTKPMSNVRHLLVQFEGGTYNEQTGKTEYSEEEKQAAKAEANGYLKTWKEGKADETSFIELVKKHSDDSSAAEGGLFEDIHPDSNYVKNFRDWAVDPVRKPNDADVIETEYGYHVMYYVGESDMNYRDYMIIEEMRTADQQAWIDGILNSVTTETKNTSKLNLDLVLVQG